MEVEEGFWLQYQRYTQGRWWYCSKCDHTTNNPSDYCPNCGSKNKTTYIAYCIDPHDNTPPFEHGEINEEDNI